MMRHLKVVYEASFMVESMVKEKQCNKDYPHILCILNTDEY